MPARIHDDAHARESLDVVGAAQARFRRDEQHRSRFRDRNAEDPGDRALAAHRDAAHRDVEAIRGQRFEQLRPAEGHEVQLEVVGRRVGPRDLDVEAGVQGRLVDLARVLRRGRPDAPGRVVAAGPDPQHLALGGERRTRREQAQERAEQGAPRRVRLCAGHRAPSVAPRGSRVRARRSPRGPGRAI